ncbi:unnamed protein product [Dicrocoelium dendriticum]|nr:unnamed protein product [Dicrocoelium dendriticum]
MGAGGGEGGGKQNGEVYADGGGRQRGGACAAGAGGGRGVGGGRERAVRHALGTTPPPTCSTQGTASSP